LSSEKSKKKAIFLEKWRFFFKKGLPDRKYDAFSMVCQVIKKTEKGIVPLIFRKSPENRRRKGAAAREKGNLDALIFSSKTLRHRDKSSHRVCLR